MNAPSLQLRLMLGGALAIFFALACGWLGLNWLFQRHVERREANMLINAAEILASGLRIGPDGAPIVDAAPSDPRYAQIASGLYWQVSNDQGMRYSSSLWDQSLQASPHINSLQWRRSTMRGPFGNQIFQVERLIRLSRSDSPVAILIAQDDHELRQAYSEFGKEIAVSLAILWGMLTAAAYAQVTLGLKPLGRMRQEMDRLRRSPTARLASDYPREIEPLTEAVNALAEAREVDLSRARKRASDLAHSLKTPLAVLTAQSRRARAAGAVDAADGLDKAIASVGAALETELARSRAAAARTASQTARAKILPVVEGLIGVIERTERGETTVFEIEIGEDLSAPVAKEDLAEMLGALIENATRYRRRRVCISAALDDARIVIRVEDDGAGLEPQKMQLAQMRGRRLDEAGSGHGMGLAIVRDLTEATEGELEMTRSQRLGGLSVSLIWPMKDSEIEPPLS